jgi:hypothetical protein
LVTVREVGCIDFAEFGQSLQSSFPHFWSVFRRSLRRTGQLAEVPGTEVAGRIGFLRSAGSASALFGSAAVELTEAAKAPVAHNLAVADPNPIPAT